MSKEKKINNQNVEDILPLTPMQEGMLYYHLRGKDDNYYFEQLSLHLSGEIDLELIEQVWNYVIETNEVLRTVFRWEKLEKPLQIILKEYKVPFKIYNLKGLDEIHQKERIQEIKAREKDGIDLAENPFRIAIIMPDDNEALMIISNHHILYDGWSNGILLKEFFQTYNVLATGQSLLKNKKN